MSGLKYITKRAFSSRSFVMSVLSVAALPFFTMLVIQTVVLMNQMYPESYFDVFRVGETYNFGFIAIRSIDSVSTLSFADYLISPLSGTIMQCVIGVASALFITSESSSGYIKFYIIKGVERRRLFIRYILNTVLLNLSLIAIVLISEVCVCSVNGVTDSGDYSRLILIVMMQIVMQLCVGICASSVAIVIQKYSSIMLVVTVLFLTPSLVQYVSLLSGGEIKIDRLFFIINLINSGYSDIGSIVTGMIVGLMTAVGVLIGSMLLFINKDY